MQICLDKDAWFSRCGQRCSWMVNPGDESKAITPSSGMYDDFDL